jgi:hypothetical protein
MTSISAVLVQKSRSVFRGGPCTSKSEQASHGTIETSKLGSGHHRVAGVDCNLCPEPVYLTVEGGRASPAGEATMIDLRINEDARCDATALDVAVTIEVADGPEPVVVTVERMPSASVIFTSDQLLTSELRIGSLEDCPEEGDCEQSFRVVVSPPDRAYDVQVDGSLMNDEAGCAISNPSFSDDAEFKVTVK